MVPPELHSLLLPPGFWGGSWDGAMARRGRLSPPPKLRPMKDNSSRVAQTVAFSHTGSVSSLNTSFYFKANLKWKNWAKLLVLTQSFSFCEGIAKAKQSLPLVGTSVEWPQVGLVSVALSG